MKHTPILGWNSVKLASCILCAIVVVVAAIDRSVAQTATTDAKKTPATLDIKYAIQGPLGPEFPCKDGDWIATDPDTYGQTITIIVAANTGGTPKYLVNTFPNCVELSHKGPLEFKLNTDFVKDLDPWLPTNIVDVEFSLPIKMKPPLPGVKGPFDRLKGKPKKRGIYEDVFAKGNNPIPAEAVSKQVKIGWIGGYTVKIWDSNGELIGEVDPGVKVIDDPGGLK